MQSMRPFFILFFVFFWSTICLPIASATNSPQNKLIHALCSTIIGSSRSIFPRAALKTRLMSEASSTGRNTLEKAVSPKFLPTWAMFMTSIQKQYRLLPAKAILRATRDKVAYLSKQFLKLATNVAKLSHSIAKRSSIPFLGQISMMATAGCSHLGLLPKAVHAGVLRGIKALTPVEKCATTPVFYICSSRGHPYLLDDSQSKQAGQKVVTYFMSYEDAVSHLEEMTQSNYPHVNDCRVSTTSLEKALSQLKAKKQSRKLGRYGVDVVYRIQPSTKQVRNASKLSKGAAISSRPLRDDGLSIPMFSAEGLAIKRKGGEVVKPYYFCYEDLLDDWAKLTGADGKKKAEPKLELAEFADVLVRADQQSSASVRGEPSEPIGLVPPRDDIESVRRYYRPDSDLHREYAKTKLILGK